MRDSRLAVLKAMKQEMKRAIGEIELANFEKPYFISYLVREFEIHNVWGNYGTVYYSGPGERYRNIYAEVRVGTHEFDNTMAGGLYTNLREEESYRYVTWTPCARSSPAASRRTTPRPRRSRA